MPDISIRQLTIEKTHPKYKQTFDYVHKSLYITILTG